MWYHPPRSCGFLEYPGPTTPAAPALHIHASTAQRCELQASKGNAAPCTPHWGKRQHTMNPRSTSDVTCLVAAAQQDCPHRQPQHLPWVRQLHTCSVGTDLLRVLGEQQQWAHQTSGRNLQGINQQAEVDGGAQQCPAAPGAAAGEADGGRIWKMEHGYTWRQQAARTSCPLSTYLYQFCSKIKNGIGLEMETTEDP